MSNDCRRNEKSDNKEDKLGWHEVSVKSMIIVLKMRIRN